MQKQQSETPAQPSSNPIYFEPYQLRRCETQTPQMPEFKAHRVNVFIVTNYGRPIFVRYGDEIKCSSFLATLFTIVNKLRMFYSDTTEAKFHKIVHGKMKVYLISRKNVNYVCTSKGTDDELTINSMLDFVNVQLISCLTDNINRMLETNPTYDPTVNFSPSATTLLSSAIKIGLHSPCVLLNSFPVLPVPQATKSQINSIVKEAKQDALQVFMLMTLSHVVSIYRKKEIVLSAEDILIVFNLLQSQKSLRNSENWLTLCIPGLSDEGNLFCYASFISQHLIVVMLTDESFDMFYTFSNLCKEFKESILGLESYSRISSVLSSKSKPIQLDPPLEKVKNLLKHYIIKNLQHNQIVMSSENYFGKNGKAFGEIVKGYAEMYRQLLATASNKKQKLHLIRKEKYTFGVYQTGGYAIFFTGSEFIGFEEVKAALEALYRWVRDQQNNLFIFKYN